MCWGVWQKIVTLRWQPSDYGKHRDLLWIYRINSDVTDGHTNRTHVVMKRLRGRKTGKPSENAFQQHTSRCVVVQRVPEMRIDRQWTPKSHYYSPSTRWEWLVKHTLRSCLFLTSNMHLLSIVTAGSGGAFFGSQPLHVSHVGSGEPFYDSSELSVRHCNPSRNTNRIENTQKHVAHLLHWADAALFPHNSRL